MDPADSEAVARLLQCSGSAPNLRPVKRWRQCCGALEAASAACQGAGGRRGRKILTILPSARRSQMHAVHMDMHSGD